MKLDDRQRRVLSDIAEIVADAEITLIGGVALRVQELITRQTFEMDLVIRSTARDPAEALKRSPKLERDPKSWVAWRHVSGQKLDLLPFFGDGERPTTLFDDFTFSSVGLDSVHQNALRVEGIPQVRVAHPAYVAVMKMGAVQDNPTRGKKDFDDITAILCSYGMDGDRIWDPDTGLLEMRMPEANACLCGIETAEMVDERLLAVARDFADRAQNDLTTTWRIADVARSRLNGDDDQVRSLFRHYRLGLDRG